MKKLQTKVFLTVLILLTIFLSFLLISNITGKYYERKSVTEDTLERVSRSYERKNDRNDGRGNQPPLENPEDNVRRIFMDSDVYTIVLDNFGHYQQLISHIEDSDINEEEIKSVAMDIINNHKEDYYIGNLFKDRYSYAFVDNKLILVDNNVTNSNIINYTLKMLIIFALLEGVSVVVALILSKWIVDPAKKAFLKQKQFVSDASHELKTPLAVMIASADAYFNDKDEKWVHNMRNESERMTILVKELLDLASIEEKEVVYESKNLSEIVEGSILTYESLFYEKKITMKYKVSKGIVFNCNENQIKQLMSILIDNSIKHCDKNGKVNINLLKEGNEIILEVKNTGEPIEKGSEEKIFERFYKVDTSRNRDSNNYGLGLSIAKTIVEKHNGEIKAFSKNGTTTFKITWNQK